MFGKDPKKIEQMMKKLNINTRELDASEVTIRTDSGDIIIEAPEIMIMTMGGRDVYQITGQVRKGPKEEDVRTVMEHTGKDRTAVEKKLEELNNNLAKAIMELKKE
ncbi:MAG: nascent polypeptide-associated complex protein [Candidatus Aenigmarchaeota archaeon]|nr:nascent polypeptide-associated complex protein [Candidatus Aenigmarchaeota archaeon]